MKRGEMIVFAVAFDRGLLSGLGAVGAARGADRHVGAPRKVALLGDLEPDTKAILADMVSTGADR